MKYIISIFATFIFSLFFASPVVFAAEIHIEGSNHIGLGDQFEVKFLLDSQQESLNAVQGVVVFREDSVELLAVRDGSSIINFWVERPQKQSETGGQRAGEIRFSGIIPGGYRGSNGMVFSAVFQSKKSGAGTMSVKDIRLLLNDGKGTEVKTIAPIFRFTVSDRRSATPVVVPGMEDTEPPEPFEPAIAENPEMFDGKFFLVFATQDKVSGVGHYEVYEGEKNGTPCTGQGEHCWQEAQSPYLLADQTLQSEIRVKAVDKAGNERIAVISPRKPQLSYFVYGFFAILAMLGAIAWLLHKFKYGSRNKQTPTV